MLSAPTDKLYKFWAILGLGMFVFGVHTTIDAFDKRGSAYVLAQDKLDTANRAANEYFEEMNKLFEQARIYNQDPNEQSYKVFDKYRSDHWSELDRLQAAAMQADDENQKDIRAAQHALLMSRIWLAVGIVCIALGSGFAFLGFRNWVRKEA